MADAQPALPPDPVAGLVDIPLPPPVSLWPQTWEARTAIAVLGAGLIVGAWCTARWWLRNRYRRAALAELASIERSAAGGGSRDLSDALAALVRRTALAAFPRERIAVLAGPAWLAFLDRTCGGHEFTSGAGRMLEMAVYQPGPSVSRDLIGAVRTWIKTHRSEPVS